MVTAPRPATRHDVPALYDCVVTHTRTAPLRHSFAHRTHLWLVDVDRLPRLPRLLRPLAGFDPRDHFTGTAGSIRSGVDAYLAGQGVDLGGGRVVMLAHARVLGHVFNPLTLFWCHDRADRLVCVIAEVHNTYGQRHCYLLRPDADGTAEVVKDFYVSPFFPVDGGYRMRLPLPAEDLNVMVQLRRGGLRPFTATVRGRHRPATARNLIRSSLRHPWSTAAVSAAIRRHGVALWLRRLPVHPRPVDRTHEG
ncbi:DUF1365 domain-containing protein [Streptomyces sp. NPDC002784]